MKRWIARSALRTDLGVVPAWIAVVIAGAVQAVAVPCHLITFLGAGNEPILLLNLWLLLGLGLAYTAWIWFVSRQAVSPSTGTGFVLAGVALASRSFAELLRAYFNLEQWRALETDTGAVSMVQAVRAIGLVGYAAGLTLVVTACWAERWFAPDEPTPMGLARGKREPRPLATDVSRVFR